MELTLERGSVIFIDTAPLIYFFEAHPKYQNLLSELFDQVVEQQCQMVTSLITYVEIVTAPLKSGDEKLAGKYREFFTNSSHIKVHAFDLAIADETAKIRALYGFKTPDAIQLATAKMMGADLVLSNDLQWKKIKELRIILMDELL